MVKGKSYSKSGLNHALVATLIVLIILVFLALVVFLIVGIYAKSNGSVITSSVNPDFVISDGSVSITGNTIKLNVERVSGSDYNKGFQLILEDSENNAEIVRVPDELLKMGESKDITFTFNQLKSVKYITLVPVRLDSLGNEISYSPLLNQY